MKIATWNVNSLRVRLPHVLDWLEQAQPDVLAVQETKMTDPEFPVDTFFQQGYHTVFSGQKTYNGVALISREPPTDTVTDIPGFDDPQRRVLAATLGEVRVVNLYVPNGSEVGSDKYAYKLDWLRALHGFLVDDLKQYPQTVVLGDFNIAPHDRDVHDPVAWHEKILCSTPERQALERLLALGLVDVFRQIDPEVTQYTWWDYRAAGFRRNLGLRIDLILASRALAEGARSCVVDIAPRKLERPSDHAPVIAEFGVAA